MVAAGSSGEDIIDREQSWARQCAIRQEREEEEKTKTAMMRTNDGVACRSHCAWIPVEGILDRLVVATLVLLGASTSSIQANAFHSNRKGPQNHYHYSDYQNTRRNNMLQRLLSSKDSLTNKASGEEDQAGSLLAVYPPHSTSNLHQYYMEHQHSIQDPNSYWHDKAYEFLDWERDFDTVLDGTLKDGDVTWFSGGKLNVAYNAIDRHVYSTTSDGTRRKADQIALLWEGDEPDQIRRITYRELLQRVSQIANALRAQGVQKGDVVTLYMPMIPELAMTMLACARIGAVHSVVFAGFSAEALAQRIVAAKSRTVVTANVGKRGGKTIQLKQIVEQARQRENADDVIEQILVWDHGNLLSNTEEASINGNDAVVHDTNEPSFELGDKDVYMNALIETQRPYCPPVSMDAEDNLFILYTSGSTGQPKGLVHTTAGYALYAAFTARKTFDLEPNTDLFACVADCGWITGHSYVVYGPLLNGCTTFLFESTPMYPNAGRYWDMIQRHKITQFYTAPTAIRLLMAQGDGIPQEYDLSSLKVLGSVGEPINPEAWRWYYHVIGQERCTIVDTYWQTETGGHIITNLPGITPMKPGSCTLPCFGIDTVVLDPVSGRVLGEPPHDVTKGETSSTMTNEDVEGVLAVRQPWPGMARTCLGDHGRYMSTYLNPYPGFYFTGDSVVRDGKSGHHTITGRVDDVLNVSGHRIGTAEIESALVLHPAVAQAAVVGKPHPIKGQGVTAFVMLDIEAQQAMTKTDEENPEDSEARLVKDLRQQVRNEIGPFAAPDQIFVAPSLPMTRSGKIMRRILRKIVAGEIDFLGDTSTLADPSIVGTLIDKVVDPKTLSESAATRN